MSIGCSADLVHDLDLVDTLKSATREVTEVRGSSLRRELLIGNYLQRGLTRIVTLVEENSLVKPV